MMGDLAYNLSPGGSAPVVTGVFDAANVSVAEYFTAHPGEFITSWATTGQLVGIFAVAGFVIGLVAGYKFAGAFARYRASRPKRPERKIGG